MSLVWRHEVRLALRRRRLLALNVGIPLMLVTPIAFSDAPPGHAAAVYAVLFTFFGVFGSAIPLVRDAETGLLERVLLTGLPMQRYVLDRTLAGTSLDLLQLLPAAGVIAVAGGAGPARAGALIACLAAALVAANALGVAVAWLARSIAEAALFGAVVSLLLLHASGVFRPSPAGSLSAALEAVMPFSALHQGLLTAVGAAPGAADGARALAGAGAGALALLLLVTLSGGPVIERLRVRP